MNRWMSQYLFLVGAVLMAACSTTDPSAAGKSAPPQDPTRIQLAQPLHFEASDGSDVVVQPGSYRVEKVTDSQLRLVSTADAPPSLINAHAMPSPPEVPMPIALGTQIESEAYNLILLMPGGKGLEAYGSVSGVSSRGFGVLQGTVYKFDNAVLLPPGAQPRPDLVPTCLRIEEINLVFSKLYFLHGGVKNQGTGAAGPSQVKNGNTTMNVQPLQPGQFQAVVFGAGAVPPPFSVQVDSANQVSESNEQNNTGQQRC